MSSWWGSWSQCNTTGVYFVFLKWRWPPELRMIAMQNEGCILCFLNEDGRRICAALSTCDHNHGTLMQRKAWCEKLSGAYNCGNFLSRWRDGTSCLPFDLDLCGDWFNGNPDGDFGCLKNLSRCYFQRLMVKIGVIGRDLIRTLCEDDSIMLLWGESVEIYKRIFFLCFYLFDEKFKNGKMQMKTSMFSL